MSVHYLSFETEMNCLFAQAEAEGKWFYSPYVGLWFSPKEMEKEHNEGRFRWGACNWRLRAPRERLDEIEREIEKLRLEAASILRRME